MTISHYDGALKPTHYLSHKNRFYKRFFMLMNSVIHIMIGSQEIP